MGSVCMTPQTDIGAITWMSSDEYSGPDCGISIGLGNDRFLYCGEISRKRWEEAGEDAAALGNDFGWWLILYEPDKTTVLGKMLDGYTASVLMDQLTALYRNA